MSGEIYVIKHAEDEGPGLLGAYFQDLGWELKAVELHRGDQLPEDLRSAAGVVMLGGPMNVYEEELYTFLKLEDGFIRRVLGEGVPFLGICLGAGAPCQGVRGSGDEVIAQRNRMARGKTHAKRRDGQPLSWAVRLVDSVSVA